MRGKGNRGILRRLSLRITPAYAGKSDIETTNTDTDGDHPRVCGEKAFFSGDFDESKGSPPRMRGKEALSNMIARTVRITPAYAGKRNLPVKTTRQS